MCALTAASNCSLEAARTCELPVTFEAGAWGAYALCLAEEGGACALAPALGCLTQAGAVYLSPSAKADSNARPAPTEDLVVAHAQLCIRASPCQERALCELHAQDCVRSALLTVLR